MRKILSFAAVLSVCISVLMSCKPQEEEIQKPLAKINDNSIIVSIYLKSDISYVNLFRTELDKNGMLVDENDKLNRAQFIPLDNSTPAISFEDTLIVSGKKYAYCLRYCTDGVYEYSAWSDWPSKVIDDENDEKEPLPAPVTEFSDNTYLKYTVPDGCWFEFDETYSWLIVKGGQINLSEEVIAMGTFSGYIPCLVVSNGKQTRPFAIDASLTSDDPIEEGYVIDLRDILTKDFFDTAVSVGGIVLEKADKKLGNEPYNQIEWSQLAEIAVKDSAGRNLDTIKISFGTSSDKNSDFSGYERTATAGYAEKAISDFSAY